jgi:hypothetical protein
MPLRVAILRAAAKSVSGSRRAICTLAILFNFSTRGERFNTIRLFPPSADFCLRNLSPAGLAHQTASSLSLLSTCARFEFTSLTLRLLALVITERKDEIRVITAYDLDASQKHD